MDILVVGAGGLLGSNVVMEALDRNLSVIGSYHSTRPDFDIPLRKLDIRDTAGFVNILNHFTPSLVVNCAAMTDVDACERYPDSALDINSAAPKALAIVCSDRGLNFVHVSTDYIFDGESGERYHEDVKPNPIQVYGKSKLAGELGVISVHESPLVIRPSFVYGIDRASETTSLRGFPSWLRSQLTSSQEVPLFIDQYVTPSRAGSTAKTLLDLAFDVDSGLYHVAARSCITPFEFGRIVAAELGIDEGKILEGFLTDIDRDAPRPTNTCLSVEKVETQLGRPQPTVKQDVKALKGLL